MHGILLLVTFPFFCIVVSFPFLVLHGIGPGEAWKWVSIIPAYEHVGNARIVVTYAAIIAGIVLLTLASRQLRLKPRDCSGYHAAIAFVLPVITILNLTDLPFELRHGATFALGCLALLGLRRRKWPLHPGGYLAVNVSFIISAALIVCFNGDEYLRVLSLFGILPALLVWIFLRKLPSWRVRPIVWKWLLGAIAVWALVLVQSDTHTIGTAHHYGFFLGPVIEILHGGKLPLANLTTQYGAGLTTFLAGYFRLIGFVSPDAMLVLLKLLWLLEAALIYVITSSVCRSRAAGALAMVSVLCLSYFTQGLIAYVPPSIGFLRFGIPYLILAVFTSKRIPENAKEWLTAGLAAVAALWSFDLLIFTVPPMLCMYALRGEYRQLMRWALRFVACFIALISCFLVPAMLSGVHIDLREHYLYPLFYAQGFGLVSLYRRELLWLLFPALYLFAVIRQTRDQAQDKRVTFLALYGLAIFLYFVGRAVGNNLVHVSIPFVILSFWFVSRAARPKALSLAILTGVFCSSLATSDLVRGRQSPVGMADIAMLNPLSPDFFLRESAFRRTFCPDGIEQLRPYIQDGKLPLLSQRDDAYQTFACLGVGNAFGVNPYALTVMEPSVAARTLDRIAEAHPPFILIQRSDQEIVSRNVVPDFDLFLDRVVEHTQAVKTADFALSGDTVEVYEMR